MMICRYMMTIERRAMEQSTQDTRNQVAAWRHRLHWQLCLQYAVHTHKSTRYCARRNVPAHAIQALWRGRHIKSSGGAQQRQAK